MSKETVTQLAIFIENRAGRLAEVCRNLGDQGINIYGFSIADTLIIFNLDDIERGIKILRESGMEIIKQEDL